ncbi:MAG: hypothetical protein QM731_03750 [Chitinophagaceae bacterium]
MKKSKFFVLAGVVTLAVVSIFGTKPAKKFAFTPTAFANGYGQIFAGATSSHLTTIKGSLKTAFFKTLSGSISTLRTSLPAGQTLYFKP